MKKLEINGRTFQYEVCGSHDYDGYSYFTRFYEGTETKKLKKYIFFGKEVEILIPKFVFVVGVDIENPSYDKKYVRTLIEEKIKFLERKEEISKGEII